MRPLAVLTCFLLLLLTTGGHGLLFQLRLAEVRQEMRAALQAGQARDNVIRFEFSRAENKQVIWLDGGDEFEWQGERYDVLDKKSNGATVTVQAIADKKESALVGSFRKQSKDDNSSSKCLVKLLSLPFIPTETYGFRVFAFEKPGHQIFSHLFYGPFMGKVPTPPPQNVSC
jgi:hypothetical protein